MFSKGSKENGTATSSGPNGKNDVCIIAGGTTIDGNVSVGGDMRLDGSIVGDVKCGGRVVMSGNASIKGKIVCDSLVSEGKIIGNVSAKGRVHFMSTSQIKGNINYGSLRVDDGAIVDGQLSSKTNHSESAS